MFGTSQRVVSYQWTYCIVFIFVLSQNSQSFAGRPLRCNVFLNIRFDGGSKSMTASNGRTVDVGSGGAVVHMTSNLSLISKFAMNESSTHNEYFDTWPFSVHSVPQLLNYDPLMKTWCGSFYYGEDVNSHLAEYFALIDGLYGARTLLTGRCDDDIKNAAVKESKQVSYFSSLLRSYYNYTYVNIQGDSKLVLDSLRSRRPPKDWKLLAAYQLAITLLDSFKYIINSYQDSDIIDISSVLNSPNDSLATEIGSYEESSSLSNNTQEVFQLVHIYRVNNSFADYLSSSALQSKRTVSCVLPLLYNNEGSDGLPFEQSLNQTSSNAIYNSAKNNFGYFNGLLHIEALIDDIPESLHSTIDQLEICANIDGDLIFVMPVQHKNRRSRFDMESNAEDSNNNKDSKGSMLKTKLRKVYNGRNNIKSMKIAYNRKKYLLVGENVLDSYRDKIYCKSTFTIDLRSEGSHYSSVRNNNYTYSSNSFDMIDHRTRLIDDKKKEIEFCNMIEVTVREKRIYTWKKPFRRRFRLFTNMLIMNRKDANILESVDSIEKSSPICTENMETDTFHENSTTIGKHHHESISDDIYSKSTQPRHATIRIPLESYFELHDNQHGRSEVGEREDISVNDNDTITTMELSPTLNDFDKPPCITIKVTYFSMNELSRREYESIWTPALPSSSSSSPLLSSSLFSSQSMTSGTLSPLKLRQFQTHFAHSLLGLLVPFIDLPAEGYKQFVQ